MKIMVINLGKFWVKVVFDWIRKIIILGDIVKK